MANNFIRNEFERLLNGQGFKDRIEAYSLLSDAGLKITYEIQKIIFDSKLEQEASLLYQFTILKSLSIKKLLFGIEYENSIDGTSHNLFWEPFSIWTLVRSHFEAYCAFNHIYLMPRNGDEMEIIYNMWVISGLKYRQTFGLYSQENLKKKKEERTEIAKYLTAIRKNNLYIQLTLFEKKKLFQFYKEKYWQISFGRGLFEKIDFRKMALNAGCTEKFFSDAFSHLSLNSHPSNVNIFQFRDLYIDNTHYNISLFALRNSENLVAFTIRDFCTYNKAAMIIFNSLPPLAQLLVNSLNSLFRGSEYKLNNIEDEL